MSEVEMNRDNREAREENRGNDARKGAIIYDRAMPDNARAQTEANRRAGAAQTGRAIAAVTELSNEV
jgi:hypothetical protein